jgi:hypothetical protein
MGVATQTWERGCRASAQTPEFCSPYFFARDPQAATADFLDVVSATNKSGILSILEPSSQLEYKGGIGQLQQRPIHRRMRFTGDPGLIAVLLPLEPLKGTKK